MKKLFITLTVALLSLNANAADINEFTFKDFYKQNVKLQDYQLPFKKGMLVNVWATWCPPCVKELPSLMRMQQIMPDITVIAINVDNDMNKAKRFLKQQRLPESVILHLYDKGALQIKTLGETRLPVSFLINNQGQVVDVIKGYRNWTNEITMSQIKAKL
jgi:thiol-disulfide isomerase/thioredoxin